MLSVRIVTQPEPGGMVLLDLMEGLDATWISADDFSLGEPVWSMSPRGIAEGVREITVPLRVRGGTRAEVESRLSAIAMILMRPGRTAWLEWQLDGASSPTWFRLHQGIRGEQDFAQVYSESVDASQHRWKMVLTADAWGVSQRVEQTLPTIAAEQVQQGVQLGPVEGDVPAPAVVTVTPSKGLAGWQQVVNLAAAKPNSGYTGARLWRASQFQPRGDNTINGQSIQINTPSSALAGSEVLTGVVPTAITAGTYTVYLLARRGSTGSGGGWWKAGTSFFGRPMLTEQWASWQPPSGQNEQSWVRCGEITVPSGLDPRALENRKILQPTLSVFFRNSGSSVAMLDAIVLLPTDLADGAGPPTTTGIQWSTFGPHEYAPMCIDGEWRMTGVVDPAGDWHNHPMPTVFGGYPMVHPGADNWLSILLRTNPSGPQTGTQLFNYSATVKVSYRPRWLNLAAGS